MLVKSLRLTGTVRIPLKTKKRSPAKIDTIGSHAQVRLHREYSDMFPVSRTVNVCKD